MKLRDVVIAMTVGLGLGLSLGCGFAYYDWRLNPGGIFRGPDGTNWSFVIDTTLSWLIPVFTLSALATLAVLWAIRFLKTRRPDR